MTRNEFVYLANEVKKKHNRNKIEVEFSFIRKQNFKDIFLFFFVSPLTFHIFPCLSIAFPLTINLWKPITHNGVRGNTNSNVSAISGSVFARKLKSLLFYE